MWELWALGLGFKVFQFTAFRLRVSGFGFPIAEEPNSGPQSLGGAGPKIPSLNPIP